MELYNPVNPNVNYGLLWIITYQYRVSTYTSGMQDDNRGNCIQGKKCIWEFSVLSAHCTCKPKTALKIISLQCFQLSLSLTHLKYLTVLVLAELTNYQRPCGLNCIHWNKIVAFVATCVDLEINMQSEVSQTVRHWLHMLSLINGI